MGLFSSGKKEDVPVRRGNRSGTGADASGERLERRSRRTGAGAASEADALLLDPTLPEKQRARRRLVGAIALVLAAVVILPMVLDSHPKPLTEDISIDIPGRPAAAQAALAEQAAEAASEDRIGASDQAETSTQATVAGSKAPTPGSRTSSPSTSKAGAKASGAPDTAHATTSTSSSSSSNASTGNANTASAHAAAPVKPAPLKPQAPAASNSAKAAPQNDPGTPASPPGSRFAVQLGIFSDEVRAREWAAKLKAAGVPAYIERRKQADGTMRTLLRAGPFADRAAASAVIAKVRSAGLTPGGNDETANETSP
ncbi:SPOR domain-containing protein [Paraburkholderia hayleyella]|uniref:SPOR domain-containing protein n=1 Tax=Paraburkholderia hayleyella TaxID=2152889 RepID=UPI0012919DF2|nr:SPOR domain-containing protein [Paraburkholderia hayleyella]